VETNKFKASRLNDLKTQINTYFEHLGQSKIYEDIVLSPKQSQSQPQSNRNAAAAKKSPSPEKSELQRQLRRAILNKNASKNQMLKVYNTTQEE
jgi:hypothetical protein